MERLGCSCYAEGSSLCVLLCHRSVSCMTSVLQRPTRSSKPDAQPEQPQRVAQPPPPPPRPRHRHAQPVALSREMRCMPLCMKSRHATLWMS